MVVDVEKASQTTAEANADDSIEVADARATSPTPARSQYTTRFHPDIKTDPANRVPIGFRTLSIQVYDSQRFPGDKDGDEDEGKPGVGERLRSGLSSLRARLPGAKPTATTSAPAASRKDADYLSRLEYHAITPEECAQRLNVSLTAGLDTAACQRRLERNGKNVLAQVKSQYWKKLLRYLFGDFCSILWVGVIIFFISWKPLGDPPQAYNLALAIVVILVILFQAAFSALQDWSTMRVMNSITSFLPDNATVRRDGQITVVPASELVVGDIVQLTIGDKVPADMRLVECSSDVRFDRSILTGESDEIAGTAQTPTTDVGTFVESKNVALLGTHVCHGSATGLVVLTGSRTVMGRINKFTAQAAEEQTNLQREIVRFVKIIIGLTVTLVVIMLITWLAWLRVDHYDFLNTSGILVDLMSLVVAFIPEGMPIAVALTLAMVARRMRDARILPKSLSTVETMGCVNVICSDKTGTLTANAMSVVSACDAGAHALDLTDLTSSSSSTENLASLRQGMVLCNDASFSSTKDTDDEEEKKGKPAAVQGNATDAAVLRLAASMSQYEEIRTTFTTVFKIPFNSTSKYMVSVVRPAHDPSSALTILVKGAPDVLLPRLIVDAATSASITSLQQGWSRQGQRVIMLARREFVPVNVAGTTAFEEEVVEAATRELSFVGLLGIMDPPRADIPKTVASCRRAGARFFVVTGDYGLTAVAIAQQVGILSDKTIPPHRLADLPASLRAPAHDGDSEKHSDAKSHDDADDDTGYIAGGLLVEGKEIDDFEEHTWDLVLRRHQEIVFARTTPEHKLRIVQQLRERGYCVAVTGDGVNDAPALKAANVGVAMVTGNDVAIEAADLVLMGDFSSIVDAIRLGRLVFQNLQKVISYLLPAGSYSEDWPVILNVFFGCPLPLSSFLMIIICAFTDLASCLALIMEKEEFDLLSLPPRDPRKDHLVNLKVYGQSYLFMGTMQTVTAHCMFFYYIYSKAGIPVRDMFFAFAKYSDGYYGHTQAELTNFLNTGQCVYFVTLVILQIGNLMSVRNKRLSIFQADPIRAARRNIWVFICPLISLIIAIFVTEEPGLQSLFGTASVPIRFWLLPIPLAVGVVLMDELRKLLVRTFPNGPIARVAW